MTATIYDPLTAPHAAALLAAIGTGNDGALALSALADWLEECGDPRAAALRRHSPCETNFRPRTHPEGYKTMTGWEWHGGRGCAALGRSRLDSKLWDAIPGVVSPAGTAKWFPTFPAAILALIEALATG